MSAKDGQPDTSKYIFYAEYKGKSLSSIFGVLAKNNLNTELIINTDGVTSCSSMAVSAAMCDAIIPRSTFTYFHYDLPHDLYVSISSKKLDEEFATVNAKDRIRIMIKKDRNGKPRRKLIKEIIPSSESLISMRNNSFIRIVCSFDNPSAKPPIPDFNEAYGQYVYGHPIKVASGEFTRVKQRVNKAKNRDVCITMYEGRYISFAVDGGGVHGAMYEFGSNPNGDESYDEEYSDEDETYIWDAEFEVYRDMNYNIYDDSDGLIIGSIKKNKIKRILKKNIPKLAEEYGDDSYKRLKLDVFEELIEEIRERRREDDEEFSDINQEDICYSTKKYSQLFNPNAFGIITKMKPISDHLEFYSPRIKGEPLKVSVRAKNGSVLSVYIKDVEQLVREQENMASKSEVSEE